MKVKAATEAVYFGQKYGRGKRGEFHVAIDQILVCARGFGGNFFCGLCLFGSDFHAQ